MAKVIFHIDINAFFASAHLIENPELKGKPLVVCHNHSSAVITTASYEARKYGINSAMPLVMAQRLCQDLIVMPVDFELYQELSHSFVDLIKEYSPIIQQASIDECYVDMSDVIKKYKYPLDLAYEIMERMEKELLLPISIGIGPTKFLSKMASDMHKPKGITVLRKREVKEKLWPLPIEEMHGIGSKTVPLLKEKGIHYIGDLTTQSFDELKVIFGNNTQNILDRIYGRSSDIVEDDDTYKSMSQSKTFSTPLVVFDEVLSAIQTELSELIRRLKINNLVGKTISLSIRLDNYKTASRSFTFDQVTDNYDKLLEKIMLMYDEFDGEGAVTFIGLTLSKLVPIDNAIEQLNLFDDISGETTSSIIEKLNSTLNKNIFKKGSEANDRKE